MKVVERLKEAVENGEIVQIIYHGGSQPGARREIAPIKVTAMEVRARCYQSGSVKTFKVEKIEFVPCGSEISIYNPLQKEIQADYTTIPEAIAPYIIELEHLGWYVQLSQESVSVHRYFRNGKPKKGADAGILLRSESKLRPWSVFGPDLASARTYAHLGKATSLFLEQARAHAPK